MDENTLSQFHIFILPLLYHYSSLWGGSENGYGHIQKCFKTDNKYTGIYLLVS